MEARPEVNVAPLSDLLGLENLFDVKVAPNPAICGALRKKSGDVAKKAQDNLQWRHKPKTGNRTMQLLLLFDYSSQPTLG